MSKVVLDTSAVLAYLFAETGAEHVAKVFANASGLMSSVNYAELVSKLVDRDMPLAAIEATLHNLALEVIAFDEAQALSCGELHTIGKPFGLSLGDRACLALAVFKKLPVLTADKVWLKISLPIKVRLIRE